MKHSLAAPTCAIALVASLAACSGSGDKSGLPTYTPGASPSATAPSQPTKTTTTPSGPAPLAAKSANTYGGLDVVVNLPADIPKASRPSMRLFSEFLQADARTLARSKIDPSLANLASPNVVKDTKDSITAKSVEGIGSVTYTVSTVRTAGASGYARLTGCLDQSKLVQLHKDGSHFVEPDVHKYPRVKWAADINRGDTGLRVTSFTFAGVPC